ncbi:unnamed protein product, partial [Iphiclides podalirius]
MIDILKLEHHNHLLLLESRQCTLERLSWCCNRLWSIEKRLKVIHKEDLYDSCLDESIFVTPMYFVNWIDQTFDILNKLSELVSNTCSKNSEELYNKWKNEMTESLSSLHTLIDELLLSAMTLCRYCLPADQHIIKARCQVVLRETRALLNDVVDGDMENMLDHWNSEDEVTELCNYVKEFDLYNERLLQIGSFAVSCSSDEKRILALRSNLATLEALDPHLVPALIMSPESHHSSLLRNSWNKEVLEIRDSIFLIVDPAAFAEKAKQMMHQKLLDTLKDTLYDNKKICSFINIGCLVYEFFSVYNKYEPDAISENKKLLPLLSDLNKAQLECKAVSDILCTGDDFVYGVRKSMKTISLEQVHKRLKLLYTIINRINTLLHPKDNEDELFANEDDVGNYDVTHSIHFKNNATYVNSPKRVPNALSRSVFARTTNIRTPASKIPLFKLTKNLRQRKCLNINFSAQLEELCNATDQNVANTRDSLSFFYSPLRKRPSLRKAVLNRHKLTIEKDKEIPNESSKTFGDSNLVDDSFDFQITEVLNQMNDLTNTFTSTTPLKMDGYEHSKYNDAKRKGSRQDTVSSFNINDTTITKRVWNIPINTSGPDSNVTHMTMNISQPSNITTLERLNDLDLVESKLSDLRVKQLETSL